MEPFKTQTCTFVCLLANVYMWAVCLNRTVTGQLVSAVVHCHRGSPLLSSLASSYRAWLVLRAQSVQNYFNTSPATPGVLFLELWCCLFLRLCFCTLLVLTVAVPPYFYFFWRILAKIIFKKLLRLTNSSIFIPFMVLIFHVLMPFNKRAYLICHFTKKKKGNCTRQIQTRWIISTRSKTSDFS